MKSAKMLEIRVHMQEEWLSEIVELSVESGRQQ